MNSQFITISRNRPGAKRLWALFLLLLTVGIVLPATAAAANFVAVSRALVAAEESCPNGAIDPGETNVVNFVIKNDGDSGVNNVRVTLASSGNVEFSLEGEKNLGNFAAKEEKTVSFRFRAGGACGGSLTPTLSVVSDGGNSDVAFGAFQLGLTVNQTYAFSATAPINIVDNAKASPYPSTINVANVPHSLDNVTTERVDKVTVTLTGITHGWSRDINALLVGPQGQKLVLMREVGGPTTDTAKLNSVNLTFDQGAASGFPLNAQITTGSYRPTDNGVGAFPDEPNGTPVSDLAGFNAINPNGEWRLFVYDDQNGDAGQIAGGWSLNIRTKRISCCGSGETFPFITKAGAPVLTGKEIDEDTIFTSETIDESKKQSHTEAYTFKVGDLETSSANLVVTATSSNEALIKSSNLKLGGQNGDRTLDFKTEPNAFGTAQITITVKDGSDRTSSATFTLTVKSINDEPTFPVFPRNQAANEGKETASLPFVVADVETPAENILVTGKSLDPGVVPDQNIVFESINGANRTVRIIPSSNTQSGTATIQIIATDSNGGSTTNQFLVSFATPVGSPTIEPISDTSTPEDTAKSIVFAVRNSQGTASGLTLSAAVTSNPVGVVTAQNIQITGTGVDRTVTITPTADTYGSATITITAKEGAKESSIQFNLNVVEVNDAPVISGSFGERVINEDSETSEIAFSIADKETAVNAVINNGVTAASGAVWATSSNTDLVPNNVANIIISGTGADRTVKIKPAANAYGRSTITVFFRDTGTKGAPGTAGLDVKTESKTFLVTVNAVNDAPTIQNVNDLALTQDETSAPVLVNIFEDAAVDANSPPRYVDNDQSKGVIELTIPLQQITAGLGNETEQTVTISATTDRPDRITGLRFDGDANKVKSPTVDTVLRYKPVVNAYGEATITLTLTDNGTGAAGTDNRTTVRKFKINIQPINDLPSVAAISNPPAQALNEGIMVPLTISDVETSNNNLTATAQVLNVQKGSISGGVRTLTPDNAYELVNSIVFDPIKSKVVLTPNNNADGKADIQVTITDRGATDNGTGAGSTTQTFTVDWSGLVIVNKAPVIANNVVLPTINEDDVAYTEVQITDDADINNTVLKVLSISDTTIVPTLGVGFSDSGSVRTMVVAPAANQFGTVNITFVAVDLNGSGLSSEPKTVTLTIRPVEDNPTISLRNTGDSAWTPAGGGNPIKITANEDANPVKDSQGRLVEINIGDAETSANNLVVSVTSKETDSSTDSSVVPPGNITQGGSGDLRTLSIVPAANKSGTARITVTVTDGANRTATTQFDVAIQSVNDKPEIAQVGTQTIDEDASTVTVTLNGLKAGGGETGQILELSHSIKDKDKDSNTLLENISITPSTINVNSTDPYTATLSFRPVANKFGTSTVKIIVKDNGGTDRGGQDTTEMSFDVVVREVNDAPTIPTDNLIDPPVADIGVASFGPLGFTITDVETSVNDLVVTFTSDNPSLVPNNQGTTPDANLQLTGSGATRGIIVRPLPNAAGVANITVKVEDTGKADGTDKKNVTKTFKVTVSAGVNPRISVIPDITLNKNEYSEILTFTVTDAQSAPETLVVSRSSSNTDVLPISNINLANDTGATRRLVILSRGIPGTAVVTLTVKDPENHTGERSFKVTVRGDAPTITQISNREIALNGNSGPIPFTISDTETIPQFLEVTRTSSNTDYLPVSGISLFGTGNNRVVSIQPAANKSGSSTVTITVTDEHGQSASTSFTVTTTNTNQAPTISAIGDVSIVKGSNTGAIAFTVADDSTPVANLTLSVDSSNKTLVPNANAVLGGSGANRTITVTPVATEKGETTITISVTDGDKSATRAFKVTVNEMNLNPDDLNGDGKSDLVFQNAQGYMAVWHMNGTTIATSGLLDPNNVGDTRWVIIDTADFNGDGKTDLLFQHSGDGSLAVWYMNGRKLVSPAFVKPSSPGNVAWKAIAAADFNADGKADIFFQHTDGTMAVWYLNGVNVTSTAFLKPNNPGNANWRVVGTGHFNGDNKPDIAFQHTNGTLAVWFLDGVNVTGTSLINPSNPGSTSWKIKAVTDLNGDGKSDLVFQHNDGTLATWLLNGANLSSISLLTPQNAGAGWNLVAP